jgi:hypothetical protein
MANGQTTQVRWQAAKPIVFARADLDVAHACARRLAA